MKKQITTHSTPMPPKSNPQAQRRAAQRECNRWHQFHKTD